MFVQVQDVIPFSIGLSSDEGPIAVRTNGVFFPKGQSFPSVKVIAFQRSNLFHLEAFYVNPDELPPGTSPKISCVTVYYFRPFCWCKSVKLEIILSCAHFYVFYILSWTTFFRSSYHPHSSAFPMLTFR